MFLGGKSPLAVGEIVVLDCGKGEVMNRELCRRLGHDWKAVGAYAQCRTCRMVVCSWRGLGSGHFQADCDDEARRIERRRKEDRDEELDAFS